MDKSLQQVAKQCNNPVNRLMNVTKDGRSQTNITPLDITKRSMYVAENIFVFSEAASNKIYNRTKKSFGLSGSNDVKSKFR